MHERNCVVTLTYRPEDDPGELSIEAMQSWTDILRHRAGVPPFRYLLSGELMQSGSPHYHVCLFGFRPLDEYFWKFSASGDRLFRSPLLESTWPYGHALIGTLDFASASYVAGYVLKKVHESINKREAGVDTQLPFRLSSSNPAVGRTWFEKYWRECLRDEIATPSGTTVPLPRYYLDLLKEISPNDADAIRRARASASALRHNPDFARMPSRELHAKLKHKLRMKS